MKLPVSQCSLLNAHQLLGNELAMHIPNQFKETTRFTWTTVIFFWLQTRFTDDKTQSTVSIILQAGPINYTLHIAAFSNQALDTQMVEDTHPSYDIFQLFCSPSDSGHAGVSRDRTYVIGSHCHRTSCTFDPDTMHEAISTHMRKKVMTEPHDYLLASWVEVQQEAQMLAIRRNIPFQPDAKDFKYLLTKRERDALRSYEESYEIEYGASAVSDHNLICFLGDNGTTWKTWSARSNQIPTLRRNSKSGLFWVPSLGRFMVAREKLCALGWPIDQSMSRSMLTDPVPTQDILRAADLAGNAMHFTTCANAQLLALTCFRPLERMG